MAEGWRSRRFEKAGATGSEVLAALAGLLQGPGEEGNRWRVHAAVFTLLAFSGAPERVADAEMGRLWERLLCFYPARVITLSPRPGTGIDAAITVWDRLEDGGASVFSQWIDLRLGDGAGRQWLDWVQPLVLGDVPRYLWWREDAPPALSWHLLAATVDHLLIDSRSFGPPAACLGFLAEASEAGLLVDDLHWYRLAPWRRLLADLADDPATRGVVLAAERVVWNPTALAGWDRWLLLGWLASRLRWEAVAVDEDQRLWCRDRRRAGARVAVEWAATPHAPALALEAGGGRLAITAVEAEGRLWLKAQADAVVRREPVQQGLLELLGALLEEGHAPAYAESWRTAQGWLGLIGGGRAGCNGGTRREG